MPKGTDLPWETVLYAKRSRPAHGDRKQRTAIHYIENLEGVEFSFTTRSNDSREYDKGMSVTDYFISLDPIPTNRGRKHSFIYGDTLRTKGWKGARVRLVDNSPLWENIASFEHRVFFHNVIRPTRMYKSGGQWVSAGTIFDPPPEIEDFISHYMHIGSVARSDSEVLLKIVAGNAKGPYSHKLFFEK